VWFEVMTMKDAVTLVVIRRVVVTWWRSLLACASHPPAVGAVLL
jgi:hypothetical protein